MSQFFQSGPETSYHILNLTVAYSLLPSLVHSLFIHWFRADIVSSLKLSPNKVPDLSTADWPCYERVHRPLFCSLRHNVLIPSQVPLLWFMRVFPAYQRILEPVGAEWFKRSLAIRRVKHSSLSAPHYRYRPCYRQYCIYFRLEVSFEAYYWVLQKAYFYFGSLLPFRDNNLNW